jgi:hypothetical protein
VRSHILSKKSLPLLSPDALVQTQRKAMLQHGRSIFDLNSDGFFRRYLPHLGLEKLVDYVQEDVLHFYLFTQ